MTFKNNFIVEVKCNGKVMRIRDGVIALPFGSEYSIYMKNLNSRKAVASLTIDGSDALDGHHRILMPNSSITINGFMKGMQSTNKFKFTRKTKRISDHRGDFPDDGIIRVEFWFEKAKIEMPDLVFNRVGTWTTPWDSSAPLKKSTKDYPYFGTGYSSFVNCDGGIAASYNCNSSLSFTSNNINLEEGITVKGSKLNEDFVYSDIDDLEKTSNVICIKLRGYNEKETKKIKKPIYTKTKLVCEICGTKSKSFAKYCRHCGNNIE
jgi:hypothetical protein